MLSNNKNFISIHLIVILFFLISCNNTLKFLDTTLKVTANVRYNHVKGIFKIEIADIDSNAVAYGTYTKSLEDSGWDKLAISSYLDDTNKYDDDTKAFAMGYLEGYLTSARIWDHYSNFANYFFFQKDEKGTTLLKEFFSKNLEWIKKTAIEKRSDDFYWHHVYLVIRQVEGMVAGYNEATPSNKNLNFINFHIINAFGDLNEILFWDNTKIPNFNKMSADEIVEYILTRSHCTSLIKISPNFSDVWFGHSTWSWFFTMTRIFKEYRLRTKEGKEKSRTVAFSGYPGAVSSIDDFYITDRDLYINETSNDVFKDDLFKNITPSSVLTWLRTIVANRLSDNGKSWTEIFTRYNSGTYNNQYQILDMKLIHTEKNLVEDGALWIVETIPGFTESADVTEILRYGYWPSYNVPYFKTIREKSGYDELLITHPELKDTIDYNSCARANILRRDQSKIVDIESFKKMMRYNNFQNDSFSKGDPCKTIACRKDLTNDNPECFGNTDSKVATIRDVKGTNKKKITIVSGPSSDMQIQFDYSTAECAKNPKYKFNGLPNKLAFQWTEYVTTLFED